MKQQFLPDFFPQLNDSDEISWHQKMTQAIAVNNRSNWPDRFGVNLRNWLLKNNTQPKKVKILSLFSGGGGLDIGFHDAGFETVEMVELEEKYTRTLKANAAPGHIFEYTHILNLDIRHYSPSVELMVDFIIGGPPCQTFSAAGRRAAGVLGTNDPRGTLFEEYVRILEVLKPRGFLFENVYGIVGAQQGQAWSDIKDAFKDAGYNIYYRILDSADYGVPQHRERLFIVGLRDGEFLFPRPTHGPDAVGHQDYFPAQVAVEGADITGVRFGLTGQYGYLLNDIPPGLNYSFYTEKMGHPNPVFGWRSKFSDYLYKADPDTPVRTIKAQGGQYTGPFSWENRIFSISELKRLQTIPDDYVLIGNRQIAIEQIGNSVPPQMARMLALAILDQVYKVGLPFPMHYISHNQQLGFRQRKRDLTEVYAEKARNAIRKLEENGIATRNTNEATSFEEIRHFTHHFSLAHNKTSDNLKVLLQYTQNKEAWTIAAKIENEPRQDWMYEIIVTPISGDKWVLPTQKAILKSYSQHDWIFTALWKALEEKVKHSTGIADLVQLCGYYQYAPRIRAQMSVSSAMQDNQFWRVLQSVVAGLGVRKQMSSEDLGLILEIEQHNVLTFCEHLRLLGYEVRNNNTNSQMDLGDFLIPYAFPTLTPRSLQRRKKLRNSNE